MGESSVPMREGECRRTRNGVLYCRIPRIGVRFCPKEAEDAGSCRSGISISGDRRRGRWVRRRVAAGLRGLHVPAIEV